MQFTFIPEDFYLSAVEFVVPVCNLNNWDKKIPQMENKDGAYTYTYSNSYHEISRMWPCYKFVVNGSDWLGWKNYKYKNHLPNAYKRLDGEDDNFMISELKQNF